ncbi:MAG: M1 family aminopeptidase [Bacteroidia bacterium]|nr:M1 family aminopeptidase [Bacteroidia bacterium]
MGGLLLLLLGAQQADFFYGKLLFKVNPPDSTLEAEVEWHFQGFHGDTLAWDLSDNMSLLHLSASFPIQYVWRDPGRRRLYMRSAQAINGGREWVRVSYRGIPSGSGFGSYAVRSHATGWAVWTLSQPYGAPDWLFCQDGLGDKVDSLDMCVITPSSLIGVGNGKLVADSIDAQGRRWRHFQHRYPIAIYLIAFAASNYVIQEYLIQTPFHRFTLRNYVYPQDTAVARRLSEQFIPYIVWLEERLGPYPFAREDYNQVQIGWRGGMEHQTITFFGSYSLELWAHELAHQWFGDWVTCGSWRDIWLNEAFGTYLGGTVFEAVAPQSWKPWLKAMINVAWRDTQRTIYVEDTTDVWRIFHYPTTYAKGALALHTLRTYVGDTVFWEGLRAYLNRHAKGFARTDDFREAVRSNFGEEVTNAFLQSWIYSPHYPQARLQWTDEGAVLLISERAYPMRLPLRVLTASGSQVESMVDFMNNPARVRFSEEVLRWEIDPDTLSPYWRVRKGAAPPLSARIFPNPFSDHLVLHMKGLRRATLYDLSGRLLASYEGEPQDEPVRWDVSLPAAGLFLLQMEGEKGLMTQAVLRLSP